MVLIEFFSGSSSLSDYFERNGSISITLDNRQVRQCREVDYKANFLEFDYKVLSIYKPTVLYFGLPCTAWSKASGGVHFDRNYTALTSTATDSILMLAKVFEIISFFPQAVWYIENPAGRLFNSPYMQGYFKVLKFFVYRFDMAVFGFPTKKQTDLFTNSTVPLLYCPTHRVNGRYQSNKFSNLSLKQRQKYPSAFCRFIFENAASA